ncbi:pirin family protein [Agarivorans sp. MS3-6]|uniref:pirin family protein n=1 Tax=Agarivorans sp. TSD2052 TaxID=2937286 RepID=UPI0020107C26|nr:pirin-like bicupin family protein [Agarivorans sp. TSD2052]UPW19696.1 pirin family protein [Agarivorans sp. TSD2052]
MHYFRPASERGLADLGWLKSRHSFSFSHYYDPQHMGYSVLRVINQDHVAPGKGFDTHQHREMEIISYVTKGVVEHIDSLGNRYQVPAGDIQVMSAGTGVSHSEYNASQSQSLEFLQIWIKPQQKGLAPGYQQASINQQSPLTALVTHDGRDGSLILNQDAAIYRLLLPANSQFNLEVLKACGYLQVISGAANLKQASGFSYTVRPGDGVGLSGEQAMTILTEDHPLEALWFDLPSA